MENAIFDQPGSNSSFDWKAIPIKMGIIITLMNIVCYTIANLFLLKNLFVYFAFIIVVFITTIILLGNTASQQRKAMGGFISLKEAFKAIFIVILILVVVNAIYSYIYLNIIDPDFTTKMKDATLAMMEKMGTPQSALDEAAKSTEQKMQESKKIGNQLLSVAWGIVIYSIFGFICAAIVKREKPEAGMR